MNEKYKIKLDTILLIMLFLSMFKVMYVPALVRQLFKVLFIIVVFLFLVSNLNKKKLLNIALLYPISMVISGLFSYFCNANTGWSILEAVLNALLFYTLYIYFYYVNSKGNMRCCIKDLYNIVFFSCLLNIISIFILGSTNDGEITYFFGNKFSVGYLLILLVCLFCIKNNLKYKKNRIELSILILLSMGIMLYINAITAFVVLVLITMLILTKNRLAALLLKPTTVTFSLIISAVVVLVFDLLLQVSFIHKFVFDTFNKSISIYGRQLIYSKYLIEAVSGHLLFGRGYNNSFIYMVSQGVFGNAQNGLCELMVAYGIIGVFALLLTVYFCFSFKERTKSDNKYYCALIVYGMIAAAVLEVSIDWVFFIGIFLTRFSNDLYKEQKLY